MRNAHAALIANALAAIVEAMGYQAENQHRLSLGHSIAYGDAQFHELIERRGLSPGQIARIEHGGDH